MRMNLHIIVDNSPENSVERQVTKAMVNISLLTPGYQCVLKDAKLELIVIPEKWFT